MGTGNGGVKMKLLVTNPSSRLSRELSQTLGASHDVELASGPFEHGCSTNDLTRNVDVVVHSLENEILADETIMLDRAMRQTYNLLSACIEEKVRRFIFLGSLEVMKGYDEDYLVNEKWRPVPTSEITTLCVHMAEFVCREFGREGRIDVYSLRLGDLQWEEPIDSTSMLRGDDALQAIQRAVEQNIVDEHTPISKSTLLSGRTWSIFHIQSILDFKEPRFNTSKAQEMLGFVPEGSIL